MKLLLVSNFSDIPYEHYLLNLLFCEGLQHFHLRKMEYTREKMRRYLERIPSPFHNRIILHSHFDLISEYGLCGAHFTKRFGYDDYTKEQGIDGNSKCFDKMGFSLHAISEVSKFKSLYDYIFLSPIFDSISNKGYNSKFKLSNLKSFLQKTSDRPEIIALGGINHTKVEMAANVRFDGIALLGYIWTDFETNGDIIAAIRKFEKVKRIIGTLEKNKINITAS